jgi:hypothetical protein
MPDLNDQDVRRTITHIIDALAKAGQDTEAAWKAGLSEDVRAVSLLVNDEGRVILSRPSGPITQEQMTHVLGALLRTIVASMTPAHPDMPPQEIANVLASTLRSLYGPHSIGFLGVYVESIDGQHALLGVDSIIPGSEEHSRAHIRGASSLAISCPVYGGGVKGDVPAPSTEVLAQHGARVLNRFVSERARRRAEAAMEAGIPFVPRRGGQSNDESDA